LWRRLAFGVIVPTRRPCSKIKLAALTLLDSHHYYYFLCPLE
jgi:hypothetical protein